MPPNLISENALIYTVLSDLLSSSSPVFVGRVGGSDTDAVVARLDAIEGRSAEPDDAAMENLAKVKKFNGYYDFSDSRELFLSYIDTLYMSYLACSNLALVDAKLLTMYFPESINKKFHVDKIRNESGFESLISAISVAQKTWRAFPYTFYQSLHGQYNLFRVFERVLVGKKVLAVTPFATSIQANWSRRHQFFLSYEYPEYELHVINTPITYDGLPREFYPQDNWFATMRSLQNQINSCDFDIALLSCGSYAMPLGLHIANTLKKRAIYVGGVLQLFFGIMGRRYSNEFFLSCINPREFIEPIEKERFLAAVDFSSLGRTEHFGAYF